MKKRTILILAAILTLMLAGCNTVTPAEPAAEPAAVSEAAVESEATATPAAETASEGSSESELENAVAAEATEESAPETSAEETSAGEVAETALTDAQPEFDPDAPPLVLAFIPQENPEKLLGDIEVIAEYLEGELGFPVEGFVTQDHAAAVEALRNSEADISFMGALPYVLAHKETGAEVILAEVYRGYSYYTGRIFVRKDSGIETPEDLRGKSIAFADPISESGYLYPLHIFVQAGLLERGEDPQNFFGAVYFAGGYQQAIQAVVNGYADAAGVSQYSDLLLTPDQLPEVTWIAESDKIPSHTVIARQGLDPARVAAFKKAMLKLNEPDYRYLLQYVYSPDGYVEASHEDYISVEEIARLYGFIK